MSGATTLKKPIACTDGERQEFARLVRQGFPAAQALDSRIRDAKCLAFYHAADDNLVAVAALKGPSEGYRREVFTQSDARVSPAEYPFELGWVFVIPSYRRHRIAEELCRTLLARVPTSGLFATTRPDNVVMIRILSALGFVRVGTPYPRRDEELVLYLRPCPTPEA